MLELLGPLAAAVGALGASAYVFRRHDRRRAASLAARQRMIARYTR